MNDLASRLESDSREMLSQELMEQGINQQPLD